MSWQFQLRWILLAANLAGLAGARAAQPPRIVVTADGRGFQTVKGGVFVPFGVTYFRPGTGWAPQVWKTFDAAAVERDFKIMKAEGVNCVRVFLTFGSFLPEPGKVSEAGLSKFDQFLDIADRAGIYVHPTGPDHWEGLPNWAAADRYADEAVIRALEEYWKVFAARYRGRTTIFAIDLLNEPAIQWESAAMKEKWGRWIRKAYPDAETLSRAWGKTNVDYANPPVPPPRNALGSKWLLDYQHFREELADDWTRRQVSAIRAADPARLITAGLVQWSIPSLVPGIQNYAAFRPSRLAPMLDFMEIHFYPLDHGFYEYESGESEARNLSYLEGVVRAAGSPGKPLVLAEFGWYSGKLTIDNGRHRPASEESQAGWDTSLVRVSKGWASGWLNWGFFDQPEATDPSQGIGLFTADGKRKAWGREFSRLAREYKKAKFAPREVTRPELDWDACVTDTGAGDRYREEYFKVFVADPKR